MKVYISTSIDGVEALLIHPQSEDDPGIWDVPHILDIDKNKIMDYTLLEYAQLLKDIGITAVIDNIHYDVRNDILNIRVSGYIVSEFYWWLIPKNAKDKKYSMAVKAWLWDQTHSYNE